MKYICFILIIISSLSASAAKGVKCKIYQEYLNESSSETSVPKEIELKDSNKKESAYLKTVVSNFDAELRDNGVLLAVKNELGNHQKLLRFKKGNSLSQTFEYSSLRPNSISNRVRVDCLQGR